jgi:hypothetical protein
LGAERPTPTLNPNGFLEAVTAPAPDLRATLEAFRAGLQAELSTNLVAVYISGSLVMGDFEPPSSDVDFLVVTREPVQRGEAQRVVALHHRLALAHRWGSRLEGGYAAQTRLRPWGIDGPIVAVEPGEGVRTEVPSDYSADNMLAIRDYSLTFYGPAPGLVLPPVDRLTLETALRDYLAALLARPAAAESSPTELASWVLNIARCLYGLQAGRPCTKREAASWLACEARDLEPVLATALAVRHGNVEASAVNTLRTGFGVLQERYHPRAITRTHSDICP